MAANADAQAPDGTRALERAGVREVIVQRVGGLDATERADVRDAVDGRLVDRLRLRNTEVLRVPVGELTEAVAALNARDDVRYAEANAPVHVYSRDEYWPLQWGLENTGQSIFGIAGTADADIDAPEAWATSTGAGVTVGVVDTGVDSGHVDLAGQLVGNPGETGSGREANGIDDDGNGLTDDWRGWDFTDDASDDDATPGPDNLPEDLDGHGTHVSGTIGAARDNGDGVAGVAPDARLMPLRVLGAGGVGRLADVAEAFDYAGDLRLPVVNASFGGPDESPTMLNAITAHPDTLYVVAAGNGGKDGVGHDLDGEPEYPCATAAVNVLCVGASDGDDARAHFSNFGVATVDLFAPGVDIVSTYPTSAPACDTYCGLSGTSMAAPHVAGVAALVAAVRPALRGDALKQALIDGAETKPSLEGSVSGGRLNAVGALAAAGALAALVDGDPEPVATCPEPVEASPAVDASPVVDGTPAVDASPVFDGIPAVDTNPAVEASPAVDTTPAVEASPAVASGDGVGDACGATTAPVETPTGTESPTPTETPTPIATPDPASSPVTPPLAGPGEPLSQGGA